MLKRTWNDFVESAHRLFGEEANKLDEFMRQHKINKKDVLCYINWGEGMTEEKIAICLNMTHQAVNWRLQKIKTIWPHLFSFPDSRIFTYNSDRDDEAIVRGF